MKKAVKELLKEAYKSSDVCQEWKDMIKEAYPKVCIKPKLEVGKWYKNKYSHLICLTKVAFQRVDFYGLYTGNQWTNNNFADIEHWISGLESATKEEVKTALIKEAKRRGVEKGSVIKYLDDSKSLWSKEDGGFLYENGCLYVHSVLYKVFGNGKWATPIETITKAEAEKQLNKKIID